MKQKRRILEWLVFAFTTVIITMQTLPVWAITDEERQALIDQSENFKQFEEGWAWITGALLVLTVFITMASYYLISYRFSKAVMDGNQAEVARQAKQGVTLFWSIIIGVSASAIIGLLGYQLLGFLDTSSGTGANSRLNTHTNNTTTQPTNTGQPTNNNSSGYNTGNNP